MNDTLTSLINDVYTLTNRPDLVGETTLAVRNATLKCHNLDFFAKDLFETGIQFDYENQIQSLDYKEIIPRWRALKYLRKCDSDGTPNNFLEVVTPDNLLDSYSLQKADVCYVAGMSIKIRSCTAEQFFLLGCYVHPDVTPDNYNSWVADEQPAAIIYEAATTVFKMIGADDQSAVYNKLAMAEQQLLIVNSITAVGY